MEGDRGLDPLDHEFPQRPAHALDGFGARAAPGDELRHHGVVVGSHPGALVDAAVHPDPDPAGGPVDHDLPRRRQELVLGILGVDAGLDGVAADGDLLLVDAELLAGGHPDHGLHDVDTGDGLGDGVLHLHPGVHLEEVEAALRVDQELAGAGPAVVHRLRRGHGGAPHLGPEFRSDAVARGLLDHLLVAPLDGALPLEEVDAVAEAVGEDLDLDVPGLLHELLDVEGIVPEGGLRLGARALEPLLDLLGPAHQAHALAATARAGLHHHRKADLLDPGPGLGVGEPLGGARHDGHPGRLHGLPGRHLVAHLAHDVAGGADEDHPPALAEVGEVSVLGEESVTRVDGLRAAALRDLEDPLHPEVGLGGGRWTAGVGLVGVAHVEGVAVHVGVDGHRLDAHFVAGADHPHRDLAPVGDEDLLEHLPS